MTTGSTTTIIYLEKDHDDIMLLKDMNKIIIQLGITNIKTLHTAFPYFAQLKDQLHYECNKEE